jgi:hypothetical protein
MIGLVRSSSLFCVRRFHQNLMRVLLSVASISLLLIVNGCEVSTTARIQQGPTFSLDGSGRLASFTIYGPPSGRKIATPYDEKSQVWSIQPSNGFPDSILVARMNLVYGSVPKGYIQTVPPSGSAPGLSTGLVYYFIAETTGAPWAQGFFYMDKTGPIRIEVPGLCPSAFVGDVKPVKCGTKEPYVEPTDLEQFAKGHRAD